METIKVNGSPTPFAPSLFKSAPTDAKLRTLAPLPLPPPASAGGCELPSPPVSSPSSSTSSSSDKTDNHDNHDSFGFLLPDTETADMRREEERLKTFEQWPLSYLSPELLAKNGFYYLGRGDEVRCAFCKVEIMRWEDGDDPAKDHQRWAPQCPFLRQVGSGNVPLETNAATGRDECGVRAPPPPSAAVRMTGPVHTKYASEAARLRSFKEWPRCMRQKPEDLAEAGFFYTGNGDKTKCFYCDGGLKDWEPEDDPWEQHARWFDRCAYVQLVKGKDYIQKVITEACAIPPEKDSVPIPNPKAALTAAPETDETMKSNDQTSVEDSKLCKICYAEERNVCFVPCGHVVACAKCALSTDKCPMCRRTFQNAMRIYFS